MGNSPSSLEKCLVAALAGESALVATPSKPLFALTDVNPYNLEHADIVPAAVTYPRDAQQVAAIVKCAADADLKVQARGGGHSYGNYCLGGTSGAVVIDMKNMQHFSMDTSTWRATLGPGHRLGTLDAALDAAGKRALPHGTVPHVGLGGHATIGGLGPSSRMWGSTLDNLDSVELVLANSTIVRASATSHPDLFFAVRGAGAGFGVVTEFVVRTYAQPVEAVAYRYAFTQRSPSAMAAAFKNWQALITDLALDRRFASEVTLTEAGMIVSGTFFGSEAELDALNVTSVFPAPDFDFSTVVLRDWLGAAAHWAQGVALDLAGGIPSAFYAQSLAFRRGDEIPPQGVDALFEHVYGTPRGTPLWFVIADVTGGAIADVPADATAYALRDAAFFVQSYAVGLAGVSEETRSWLDGIGEVVRQALPGREWGVYPGYVDPLMPEGEAQRAYWGDNLERLERIKRAVDPGDVFSNPQSVRPAAA